MNLDTANYDQSHDLENLTIEAGLGDDPALTIGTPRNEPATYVQVAWLLQDQWRVAHDGELQFIFEYRAGATWQAMKFCRSRIGIAKVLGQFDREFGTALAAPAVQFPEFYDPATADEVLLAVGGEWALTNRRSSPSRKVPQPTA